MSPTGSRPSSSGRAASWSGTCAGGGGAAASWSTGTPGPFLPTRSPTSSASTSTGSRECLGRLAERERAVLVETFYEERPSAAIAERLGLTPDNVRTVRHRAFVRLRDCVRGGEA